MSEIAINKRGKQTKTKSRDNIFTIFKNGDLFTRLSFLIMGLGNIARKQFVKGLIYLGCEIGFLFFLAKVGIKKLKGLITLGTQTQGWVFDETLGIEVLSQGDNSMLFLLYGVCTLVVMGIFLVIYISNLYSAKYIQDLADEGHHVPTFKEDLRDLVDNKFHVTLMTIPLIMVTIFTVLPLLYMILIAFTNYDKDHQPPGALFNWVGLANFKDMLFSTSSFSHTFFPVLGWTLIWAVLATVTCYFGGIVLAILINKEGIKFKKVWRTIFVITMAIPQFITLLVIRQMLMDYGPLNGELIGWGVISKFIPFLTKPMYARIMVLVVNFWLGVPYTMLITSSILMNIPRELYEAADIDGASPIKAFMKITMPYVFFVTAPYLITQFIGNINNFNVIYFLTKGEPLATDYYFAGKTDLLVTWLYKLTVNYKDYSRASVIGIAVFVISVIISLVTFNLTSSAKSEEDFQ
ncbi:MAG: sugar ABC transporter permease [Cellulosilyticum sp.]|nr:sugar ABC transporter permease [Cellulosilyticum sp.]